MRDRQRVRRVDVGDGIYVAVPVASTSVPAAGLALGAGAALVAVLRLGATADGALAAGLLAVLAALAAIDLRARVLPNRIIGPAMLAVLAWQLAVAPERVPEFLLAGLGAGAFLLLPSLVRRGAVGMGDVKLAALLGLALGRDVVGALLIGSVAAVPVALALLVLGGAGARHEALPFGPFLALGAAVVLLA
jgi:prepilin signal peptidase PulO-like enzyme (type II secretory pathway)